MVQHRGQPRACDCCCPPAVGCVIAADGFERPDGPIGVHWLENVQFGGPLTAEIEDGEVKFTANGTVTWCRNFPEEPARGSVSVDVVGGEGDAAFLFAVTHWIFWEVAEDHIEFTLHSILGPGPSETRGPFKLPGGPGQWQRLRICWFPDTGRRQAVSQASGEILGPSIVIGEVYDAYGQLIFRERASSAAGAVAGPNGLQHGFTKHIGNSGLLRFDNYLADIPPSSYEYAGECAECELFPDQPDVCLMVREGFYDECGFTPLLRDMVPVGEGNGTEANWDEDFCTLPLSVSHFAWIPAPLDDTVPASWGLQIAQEDDGTWVAIATTFPSFHVKYRAVLDLAGQYPLTENLLAAFYAATLAFDSHCDLLPPDECFEAATITVAEGPCDYVDDSDVPPCCDGVELPETIFLTASGGVLTPGVEDLPMTLASQSEDGFEYQADIDELLFLTLFCIVSGGQGFLWLFINGGTTEIPGAILSCDPFHAEGQSGSLTFEAMA